MYRLIFLITLLLGISATTSAQEQKDCCEQGNNTCCEQNGGYKIKAFEHLDLGITAGTTGLGIDAAMPINEWMQLRAGFTFMPKFDYHMSFGVQVGDDPEKSESKFQKLQGMLQSFTGYEVDDHIDMIGQPTYWNVKLLADFYPFFNKNWHVTAGFYLGPSKIAKAFNTTEDMPSLMAVGIYNNMYNSFTNDEIDPDTGLPMYVEHNMFNQMMDAIRPGEGIGLDPDVIIAFRNKMLNYGRMGIHVGDYKGQVDANGNPIPYMMEPDENSMVKAKITVNSFKPYLGFGYSGRLLKKDPRWKIGFDCGALLWGGTPSIKTHDGTDLAKEVENIKGKVGAYVDFFSTFVVFPVLNVRITRSIF